MLKLLRDEKTFPLNLALISIGLTIFTVGMAQVFLHYADQDFRKYLNFYTPLVDQSNHILRSNDAQFYRLKAFIEDESGEGLEKINFHHSELTDEIDKLQAMLKEFGLKELSNFPLKIFSDSAREIISLAKKQKYRKAKILFDDSLYSDLRNKLNITVETLRQKLIHERDDRIEKHLIISRYVKYFFIIFLALVIISWRKVFFSYIEGIEQKKIAEEKLENQRMRVIQAEKMSGVGEVVGSIAHAMNNHLFIISGFTRQIEKRLQKKGELDKESLISFCEKTQGSMNKLTDLVRGLRRFARDARKDQFEITNCYSMVRDVINICEQDLKQSDISINVICNNKELFVKVRSAHIKQVMLNLISNSRDAIVNLQERWIEISLIENDESIDFVFKDSGFGIPKDVAENIFTPFYTTKEGGKGTGLGLSIAKRLLEDHQGSLYIPEEVERTTVIFSLPKKEKKSSDFDLSA